MRQLTYVGFLLAACSDGQSLVIATEPPGANCTTGGVKLASGGIVNYICNGLNGSGSLAVETEPAGANCTSGGVKIITASGINYICNGNGAGVSTTAEPPGSNCAAGGVKITSSSGTNYVCNGTGGSGAAKMVLDSAGATLGQFLSMFQMPNYGFSSYRYDFDILYQDASGVVVPRQPDGTLDPFLAQAVWYDMPLCQGTPYTNAGVLAGGNGATGGVPAGALLQIGLTGGQRQSYYYKVTTAALQTITSVSALDYMGNCGAGTSSITGALTLAPLAAPPPASVPGPLAIQ